MNKFSISISRQFGSLGRPIAKKMSEILNIEYFDRDIVDLVAKKMGLTVKEISDLEETVATGWARMKNPFGSETNEIQDQIFKVQAQTIRELAEKQSCIIVGRCADNILEDAKNNFNIHIYAPYEDRLLNCVNELGMTSKEAKKMIVEVDKVRDAYHMRYAKYYPNDKNHMDLMINSALLGVEGTAELLSDIVKKYFIKTV